MLGEEEDGGDGNRATQLGLDGGVEVGSVFALKKAEGVDCARGRFTSRLV